MGIPDMRLISTRRVDVYGRPIGPLIRHRNTRAIVAYLLAALVLVGWRMMWV
jgi:hypothetical protein